MDFPRLKNFYGNHYYNLFFSQWLNNFNRKTSIQRYVVHLKEEVKKDFSLLVNDFFFIFSFFADFAVSDSRSGLEVFDEEESESEIESCKAGFWVFCASNWKTYPIGCRSQSLGWFDFSATLMELQSGFRDEKVAGSLDFSFWSISL